MTPYPLVSDAVGVPGFEPGNLLTPSQARYQAAPHPARYLSLMIVIPPGSNVSRTEALARLHARIRACRRCVDAGYLDRAQPIVAGTIRDRIAIVGQAPGAVEVTTGKPFSGRAGAQLRRWLAAAGIDEAHLPYRTAITKCFPGKSAAGNGDRRPSPAEIALCAPWLEQELALLRPRVILLVGTLAIERLWGKIALDAAVGRTRTASGATLIPLPHPSGTSRWLNDQAHRLLLERALAILRRAAGSLDAAASAGKTTRRR